MVSDGDLEALKGEGMTLEGFEAGDTLPEGLRKQDFTLEGNFSSVDVLH